MAAKKKSKAKADIKTESTKKAEPSGSGSTVFPIVGIGASAGGLEALEELLDNMPANTGMAFVVVTHQHPGHASLLPELLSRETEMPVLEAIDGVRVQANHVYVGPPGSQLAILNGTLHRMETGTEMSPRLPVDYFFRSLAEDQQERAIGIILSGTGTDGTLGLQAIKGESGMAMVQQPQSAKYAGMPSSAISTGLVDYVLPPAAMPKQLVTYVSGPYLQGAAVAAEVPQVPAEPMQKIFVLLRSRTGHDFSAYKSNTLRRRIERRMNVHQIREPNQYVRYLQENPHEIDSLFKELLIGVTSFFRDPEAWASLAVSVKKLIESRPDEYSLRVWTPGCATGEEAFSMAILLKECQIAASRNLDVTVFGTDLDTQAIDTARLGRYPQGIAGDVLPQRLERWFSHDDGTYQIRKEIRELVVFAPQNVIKDPPFTKLDVLSCRNLLIYLNTDLQKKLMPIFHYALKPDGLLFLGPSETIGSFTDLFETVDKRWNIYRRRECATALHRLPEMPAQLAAANPMKSQAAPETSSNRTVNISTVLERLLLARFAPASVVVNDRGDIIYIHGRTGAYLEPSQGQPRSNVLEMAREGLQIELPAALRRSAREGLDVVRECIRVKTNGDFTNVDLSVSRLDSPESVRGLLLVTFRPSVTVDLVEPEKPATEKSKQDKGTSRQRLDQLEQELQHARESHQTTLEELQTSNEELKSANEELQSTNEELQSTNEELETSKEEMQSLNEELTTVNAELHSKVDDLSDANDDMQNLLNSTDIATVFLDNQLNIKRFTDQATQLVKLRTTDVGRPMSELAFNIKRDNLVEDCRGVLKTLVFRQREVQTTDGVTWLMRIMPYRTAENVIDGLVLTFVDISSLKQAKRDLRRMSKVFQDALDPIIIVDLQGRIVDLNNGAVKAYGFTREEMLGQPVQKVVPELQQSETADLLSKCRAGDTIRNVECSRRAKSGEVSPVLLSLALLTNEDGQPDAIAMSARQMG